MELDLESVRFGAEKTKNEIAATLRAVANVVDQKADPKKVLIIMAEMVDIFPLPEKKP